MNNVAIKGRTSKYNGVFNAGIVNHSSTPLKTQEQRVLKGESLGSTKQPAYGGMTYKFHDQGGSKTIPMKRSMP